MKSLRMLPLFALTFASNVFAQEQESIFVRTGKRVTTATTAVAIPLAIASSAIIGLKYGLSSSSSTELDSSQPSTASESSTSATDSSSLLDNPSLRPVSSFETKAKGLTLIASSTTGTAAACAAWLYSTQENAKKYYNGIEQTIDAIDQETNVEKYIGQKGKNALWTAIPVLALATTGEITCHLVGCPIDMFTSLKYSSAIYAGCLGGISLERLYSQPQTQELADKKSQDPAVVLVEEVPATK